MGNVVAEIDWKYLNNNCIASEAKQSPEKKIAASPTAPRNDRLVVGFENHGGRTFLGKNAVPFAKIIKGFGNNGEDSTEGVVYKNAIGSYLHGPLLPKNPAIADWLIRKALEIKYNTEIELSSMDDNLEKRAKSMIAKRLGITL